MTNYFRKGKSLYASTANTFSTGEGETITPASVSGLPTDTEITLTFDRVDSSGTATPTKMERIIGTISGGNFVVSSGGRGADGSTEQAHTSPVVEYIYNAKDMNDKIDGFLVEHLQTGAHRSITASNITASNVTASNITLNLGSDAQGDIFYRSSAGKFARLAPGTSGYFLKTQGAAADPVWAATTSGLVSTARARAYLGSNQLNITDNTWTKIQLNTESYDPGNNFDNATNYRFVVPTAGIYLVTGQVGWATTVANKMYGAAIYKNGSNICENVQFGGDTTGNYESRNVVDILSLAQNDYIELYCWQLTAASTADVIGASTDTFLSISFIGTTS